MPQVVEGRLRLVVAEFTIGDPPRGRGDAPIAQFFVGPAVDFIAEDSRTGDGSTGAIFG